MRPLESGENKAELEAEGRDEQTPSNAPFASAGYTHVRAEPPAGLCSVRATRKLRIPRAPEKLEPCGSGQQPLSPALGPWISQSLQGAQGLGRPAGPLRSVPEAQT